MYYDQSEYITDNIYMFGWMNWSKRFLDGQTKTYKTHPISAMPLILNYEKTSR